MSGHDIVLVSTASGSCSDVDHSSAGVTWVSTAVVATDHTEKMMA